MGSHFDQINPLRDRELGMDRNVTRRDFLNGAALTVGAAAVPQGALAWAKQSAEAQGRPGYNPPVANGLRGSHPGSFDVAHSLRDGTFWKTAATPVDTGEVYDLIVA